ncbi:MAG: methyltransferase family protein [Parcubacteria group bacterium Gr01-1014_20]|nr:MAG: methyltransferase family protein [Parcubacteria group bacterium Gr01-1014_20]
MSNNKTSGSAKRRTTCRICGGSRLFQFLSLGDTPLADAFVEKENLDKPEAKYPLDVEVCEDCGLVMLVNIVDPELLFGDNYAFYTSGSPQAVAHFRRYAHSIIERFPELAKKLTIDIAANDGVLLRPLKEFGAKVLGIDPAKNVTPVASAAGIPMITDFFTEITAKKIEEENGKASLVLANNVLAHVDDVHDFVRGVKLILDPHGVFIFEVQYFVKLLTNNQFDNVYHEHHSFYALRPLKKLIESEGMKIFDVEEVNTQGGSLRVFAEHADGPHFVKPTVQEMIQSELGLKLDTREPYKSLSSRAQHVKEELIKILDDLKKQGKKIVGYGAPAKGNTLLNFCGISTQYLDYIIDKTYFKHGKFTPGTHIPVFPIEKIQEDGPPDYYLLLVWNYAAGILNQEEEFIKKGGHFIIPIPAPHII